MALAMIKTNELPRLAAQVIVLKVSNFSLPETSNFFDSSPLSVDMPIGLRYLPSSGEADGMEEINYFPVLCSDVRLAHHLPAT